MINTQTKRDKKITKNLTATIEGKKNNHNQ